MSTSSSTSTHAARMTRVFTAPVERVYAAFSNADIGKQWWTPPRGFSLTELIQDATPGGTFRAVMTHETNGTTFVAEGEYKKVIPNQTLVWTNCFQGADGRRLETLVTLVFTSADSGTQLDITHDLFPDAATRDLHQAGWHASLKGVEKLLG